MYQIWPNSVMAAKKQPTTKTKTYGIYSVDEYPTQNGGKWGGQRCSVLESGLKQGKLYVKSDGREHYKEKPKDEELEI